MHFTRTSKLAGRVFACRSFASKRGATTLTTDEWTADERIASIPLFLANESFPIDHISRMIARHFHAFYLPQICVTRWAVSNSLLLLVQSFRNIWSWIELIIIFAFKYRLCTCAVVCGIIICLNQLSGLVWGESVDLWLQSLINKLFALFLQWLLNILLCTFVGTNFSYTQVHLSIRLETFHDHGPWMRF